MIALYKFQFGTMCVEYENNVLYKLRSFPKNIEISPENDSRRSDFSDEVFSQAQEFLNGRRKQFDIKYELVGTEFRKKVWRALQNVPYGKTATYKQIAEEIGCPKACRAVGMANNKNPLFMIVPCHRVIGSGGKLIGYAGGLEMKKYLLEVERNNFKN